jgi:PAS domain S-box-containing protein
MVQREIEVILVRQLASYLAVPIFVVDPEGTMLFYNEPAEELLGRRFEDAGEMSKEVWTTVFHQTEEDGTPIAPENLPLVIALRERRPHSSTLSITGLDGVRRRIVVTAFPLIGQNGRQLGAVAILWSAPPNGAAR